MGLIDDDASLHSRWVYGFPVLGGREDLPSLIARHHISGIVVTADLKEESRAAVLALAREQEIELSEWTSREQVIVEKSVAADSRAVMEAKISV